MKIVEYTAVSFLLGHLQCTHLILLLGQSKNPVRQYSVYIRLPTGPEEELFFLFCGQFESGAKT